MKAGTAAEILRNLPTCQYDATEEKLHLNYGWAESIAKLIDQQQERIFALENVVEASLEVSRIFNRSMSMYVKRADFEKDKYDAINGLRGALEGLDDE